MAPSRLFVLYLLGFLLAATLSAAEPETLSWQSPATGGSVALTVLNPTGEQSGDRPLVVYLQNLAAPRVGTESDASIVRGFRTAGDLVVLADYAHHPRARVPHLNADLAKLREDLLHGRLLKGHAFDPARVHIVPSGCRLLRDVEFYPAPGRPLAMDIVYPSRPAQQVGALLEFSCDNQDRMGNGSLAICSDTILDGMATEGFAVAMADHPVPPPYKGLDPMPACAWKIKAAVRTLRAQREALPLSGKIGVVGFSRGSGMALMLAATGGQPEFEGHGNHQQASSAVQAAVVMSGRFTYLDLLEDDHMLPRYAQAWGEREANLEVWRHHGALDYLTSSTLPLFLTINAAEGPDALHQMTVLRKRLAELGNDEVFLMDRTPRGHKVTLDPEILAAMRDYLRRRLQ
ncbi:MAG: hypothetical protein KDA37_08875 [Planctomycetales bacterium]|nr:hypothetical protein [Planctomycetales bacterium]